MRIATFYTFDTFSLQVFVCLWFCKHRAGCAFMLTYTRIVTDSLLMIFPRIYLDFLNIWSDSYKDNQKFVLMKIIPI